MAVATATAEETARLFHALSDPTRLGILDRLRDGERCVCDLMDSLDAAQSRLSFHLKVLKDAGLVTDRRDGRWVYYTLSQGTLAEAREYVEELKTAARNSAKSAGRKCC
ncbi:MAG TPA: metalloregulator ArsR/SmtB family transcription factor [Gemmatimonadales bacterium]|jgi:ArsR family transcriptional regulator